MDILLISQARMLRDALVAALQDVPGTQACSAFSCETVEAAIAAFAPAVVVGDLQPEGGLRTDAWTTRPGIALTPIRAVLAPAPLLFVVAFPDHPAGAFVSPGLGDCRGDARAVWGGAATQITR